MAKPGRKADDPYSPDQYLEAEWPELRRIGRSRFIWRHRVLPFAVPGGVVLIAWVYYYLGYPIRHLATLSGMALAYFILAVSILVGFLVRHPEWDEREARYAQQRRDRD